MGIRARGFPTEIKQKPRSEKLARCQRHDIVGNDLNMMQRWESNFYFSPRVIIETIS